MIVFYVNSMRSATRRFEQAIEMETLATQRSWLVDARPLPCLFRQGAPVEGFSQRQSCPFQNLSNPWGAGILLTTIPAGVRCSMEGHVPASWAG